MNIKYQHGLSTKMAYDIVNGLIKEVKQKYADHLSGLDTNWNNPGDRMDFNVSIKGVKVKGQVRLEEGEIILEGNVPLIARPFVSITEKKVRARLDELFV